MWPNRISRWSAGLIAGRPRQRRSRWAASIVIGEVLRFHVDDAVFDDFRIDPDKLHAIGRMGGPTYVRTTDRFDMPRPKVSDFNLEAARNAR